jgi:hypothetical protein
MVFFADKGRGVSVSFAPNKPIRHRNLEDLSLFRTKLTNIHNLIAEKVLPLQCKKEMGVRYSPKGMSWYLAGDKVSRFGCAGLLKQRPSWPSLEERLLSLANST